MKRFEKRLAGIIKKAVCLSRNRYCRFEATDSHLTREPIAGSVGMNSTPRRTTNSRVVKLWTWSSAGLEISSQGTRRWTARTSRQDGGRSPKRRWQRMTLRWPSGTLKIPIILSRLAGVRFAAREECSMIPISTNAACQAECSEASRDMINMARDILWVEVW